MWKCRAKCRRRVEDVARITYILFMLRDSRATAGQDAPAQDASKRRGARDKTRASAVLNRPPAPQGWNTTDEEETELRHWRGRTEIGEVEPLEPNHLLFGTFRVRSESGTPYEVEIRSLQEPINSCGCIATASTVSAPASTSRASSRC